MILLLTPLKIAYQGVQTFEVGLVRQQYRGKSLLELCKTTNSGDLAVRQDIWHTLVVRFHKLPSCPSISRLEGFGSALIAHRMALRFYHDPRQLVVSAWECCGQSSLPLTLLQYSHPLIWRKRGYCSNSLQALDHTVKRIRPD